MDKLAALWGLFHKGDELANPEKWKQHQITGTAVGAAIIALIKVLEVFGYALPISADDATQLGGTVVVVFNIVLTIITSKRAGLPARTQPQPVGQGDSAGGAGVPDAAGASPASDTPDNASF